MTTSLQSVDDTLSFMQLNTVNITPGVKSTSKLPGSFRFFWFLSDSSDPSSEAKLPSAAFYKNFFRSVRTAKVDP